jgi:hypothetical protein
MWYTMILNSIVVCTYTLFLNQYIFLYLSHIECFSAFNKNIKTFFYYFKFAGSCGSNSKVQI